MHLLIEFTIFLAIIIGSYFSLSFCRMGIISARGEEPNSSCFKVPMGKVFNAILANFIISILTLIGTLFCIIPGVIVGIRTQFTIYNIVEKEMGAIEAISESWSQTKGYTMDLFLLGLIYYFINILGLLCCCIGLLITTPMTIIGMSIVYLTLTTKIEETTVPESAEAGTPPVSENKVEPETTDESAK